MDHQKLADLLRLYAPKQFVDAYTSIELLSEELEEAKEALTTALMEAQSQDDYQKAHEILDMKEGLTAIIHDIQAFLSGLGEAVEEAEQVISENEEPQERRDYSLYGVDDTVAYDIADTQVTFKRPAAYTFCGTRYQVNNWKSLLCGLCGKLYAKDPSILRAMVDEPRQHGIARVKLSLVPTDLIRPVKIPESEIWVETNRSASDIRKNVLTLLERYGIPSDLFKVYFRRDYSALHT